MFTKRLRLIFCLAGTGLWLQGPTHAQNENEEFFKAIQKDNVAKVQSLLSTGVSANLKDKNGVPALIVASDNRSVKAFVALLEGGADPNTPLEGNVTPLMAVHEIPAFLRIGMLLAKHMACRSTVPDEFVKGLIDKGASTRAKSTIGTTPLMAGAMCGHANAVAMILKTDGVDVNASDLLGQTALIMAAGPTIAQSNGGKGINTADASTIMLLLAAGANVNATDHDGDSALIRAARWDYDAKITALLDKGGDPNLANSEGDTALIIAARGGWAKLVTLLLQRRADPAAVNKKGQTALAVARGGAKKALTETAKK